MATLEDALNQLANYDPGYNYASILPFRVNKKTKEKEFAAPGLLKDAIRALTAPGRAYSGLLDYNSPEAVQESMNMSGLLQLGGAGTAIARNPAKLSQPSSLNMFIGNSAKTWNKEAAKQAEELLAKGIDPREVWKQTGTMRGVDKALRQEIPDNLAKIAKGKGGDVVYRSSDSGGLLSAIDHPDLYKAHPDLADIQMRMAPGGANGEYMDGGISLAKNLPEDKTKSVMLHELQHAIQQREGWARGGSPNSPYVRGERDNLIKLEIEKLKNQFKHDPTNPYSSIKSIINDEELKKMAVRNVDELGGVVRNEAYKRLAGEAEARLTQSRMGMNMDERLQSYPMDMMDVPAEQQIVRGLLGGPAMSYADEAAKIQPRDYSQIESEIAKNATTNPEAAFRVATALKAAKQAEDGLARALPGQEAVFADYYKPMFEELDSAMRNLRGVPKAKTK